MKLKTTAFDYAGDCKKKPPVPGAIAVYWLVSGQFGIKWEHKGWLMPEVKKKK